MSPPATPPGTELLIDYRLSQLERAVTTLVEQNTTLIALEQRHLETREALDRAFKAIKDTDTRVREMETDMPTLRLVRGWVISGVLAIIAASGTVAVKAIATTPTFQPTQSATAPRTG